MDVHKLDITEDHCPMTFVKAKLALEKLSAGDRLEVLLRAGEPLANVPRSAVEQGYTIIETVTVGDGVHRILIEK